MPRMDGIDVSKWQGTIDWNAVRSTGIWWSACRTWDRDLDIVDATFAANRAGQSFCKYRLLYYWLEPGRALAGVDEFFTAVGALQPGEGVMLDAEQDGITEGECLQWLEAVEARTGRPAAVYTGGYTAGGAIWRSTRIFNGQRPRVFACYSDQGDCANKHAAGIPWDAWQWSSTGRVPGINANCDQDQVDHAAAFDKVCGIGAPPAVLPVSAHAKLCLVFQWTGAPDAWYVTNGVMYRRCWTFEAMDLIRLWQCLLGYPSDMAKVHQLDSSQLQTVGVPAPGEVPIAA